MKDLNVRVKTIKLLEESVVQIFTTLDLQDFLDMIPNAQETKKKEIGLHENF